MGRVVASCSVLEGVNHNRRSNHSSSMAKVWLSCFLLVAMIGHLDFVSGGEVWSSARYPNEELGPDSWRYYRVELPPVFSLFSISLARNWSHVNGSSAVEAVPLVCFGFHGPPLTVAPRESLLAAALHAGANQNVTNTGECAWFNDTIEINATNLEVQSGILHVGVFSDATPTRTQRKMIPRFGKKYKFGLGIQVFWCGTEALGGPECSLGIGSLPRPVFLKSLYSRNTQLYDDRSVLSSRSSRDHFDRDLVTQWSNDLSSKYPARPKSEASFNQPELSPQAKEHNDKDVVDLRNRKQDEVWSISANMGWSEWVSSTQKCVSLDEKQFFSLQIVDFVQELEIKYQCTSNVTQGISKCEEFESRVKESRIPLLHLRYGALPGKYTSDFLGEPSTGSITISNPKRGWWYLSIFNPMVTSKQEGKELLAANDDKCFTLKWRARSCGTDLTGDKCQWPLHHLERILQEEFESPFDSYFRPTSQPESFNHDDEWFSMEPFLNESTFNASIEQWGFAIVKVADGASGAVLSIDMMTSFSSNMEVYARYEGCPSDDIWDFRSEEGSQLLLEHVVESNASGHGANGLQFLTASNYQSLSFSVAYPMEGYWCIGLKYIPHVTGIHAAVLHSDQDIKGKGIKQLIGDWVQRLKLFFTCYTGRLSFLNRPFASKKRELCKGNLGDGMVRYHTDLSSSRKEIELRVKLHGCPNDCSGNGNCQTMYEGSRLHVISYCRCYVTHGGYDCSVTLLGPWMDFRQMFLLVFSNAAAVLPGAWALRRKACSEWVTFTLSGIASAIYHSCDVGGWCAMSFSTLQFLDFWLSFLAIVMTCLLLAGFSGPTKAMLHIGCAILTATVAKENATSGWSVLVVVLISSTGLLLGWGLETQKVLSLRLRWSTFPNQSSSACLQFGQRMVSSFFVQLRDRFHWPYLLFGLALLLSALFSNLMEMPETYWIFHSWWHICIYSSAFLLLYSMRTADGILPRRVDDLEYQRLTISSRHDQDGIIDSHEALVSELDTFPDNHIH